MRINEAPVHASLAAIDLERARSWYADKLGWEPTREAPGLLVYQVLGSDFTLFETPNAGTAKNTVMNWNVPDVAPEVARLRANGVEFEDYDFGEYRTTDGIMADPSGGKSAWFKDSEGNIIGRFVSTGIRPHFADRMKHSGGEVDPSALGFLRP